MVTNSNPASETPSEPAAAKGNSGVASPPTQVPAPAQARECCSESKYHPCYCESKHQKAAANLVPVPDKFGSYCRRDGDELLVYVQNIGNAESEESVAEVDFGVYNGPGGPQRKKIDRVPSCASTGPLRFDIPPKSFDPDCVFRIVIYTCEEYGKRYCTAKTNLARGVCRHRYLPDLKPVHATLVAARGAIALKITIMNQGQAVAGPSRTRVVFNDCIFWDRPTRPVAPCSVEEVIFPWPRDLNHRECDTLQVIADIQNQVVESNECNNDQSLPLDSALPDLIPEDARPDKENNVLEVDIKNAGNGPARASWTRVDWSEDVHNKEKTPAIDKGKTATVRFKLPDEFGGKFPEKVWVHADTYGEVPEWDDDNNTKAFSI